MKGKAFIISLLALAFALTLSPTAAGQTRKSKLFRNRYKVENTELRSKIDSMNAVIEELKKEAAYKLGDYRE